MLIENTFSTKKNRLPRNVSHSNLQNYELRLKYVKYNFCILSDKFLLDLKKMVEKFEMSKIIELSCGAGWFSYWMKKYGIPITDSVDNKSWGRVFSYLPNITVGDSVDVVKENADTDLYILSWPYMDTVAAEVWKEMRTGQYLLYIGEGYGGCTANNEFHDLISDYVVREAYTFFENFLSFETIHDHPTLYRKGE